MAKRRNNSPERDFIHLELLPYLNSINADVDIIESKAVYSRAAGRYLRGMGPPGFSDIVGNLGSGLALYIEAKAPGKRNTIKSHQKAFLKRKIKSKCFGVCIDSVNLMKEMLEHWSNLMNQYRTGEAEKYLLDMLPKANK